MSTIGRIFRVTTWGESHGDTVGCVIDGCPSGMPLTAVDIQPFLDRRRPGQSSLTTSRDESDLVEIMSGTADGVTIGTPIALLVRNEKHRATDYTGLQDIPRPGHADWTWWMKHRGHVARSGGGRASARETCGRVAAGAVAELWLNRELGVTFHSWVSAVGPVELPDDIAAILLRNPPSREEIEEAGKITDESTGEEIRVRCPHPETAQDIANYIRLMKYENDTAGGIVTGVIMNLPVGVGEPVFDKLPAELSKALMSIPAAKAFEFGSGFEGTRMRGSEHNDRFTSSRVGEDGRVLLLSETNHSGGCLGGISTGAPVTFRVGFKPVSSIGKEQKTMDLQGQPAILKVRGRHDPCVLPRCPPIVDAMCALVIADLVLRR